MENKKLSKAEIRFLTDFRKLDTEHKKSLLELMKFFQLEQTAKRKKLS